MTPLYLDTHSGPVIVTTTGNETVSRHGDRYVEVTGPGYLREPMFVLATRLATDPSIFDGNTIKRGE